MQPHSSPTWLRTYFTRPLQALPLCLLCISLAWLPSAFGGAIPLSDLLGSEKTQEFTPAERAYFNQAIDKYKSYWLNKAFMGKSIARWLDNDRIVISASNHPGWAALPTEQPKLIAIHVVTGEFTDLGYRGELLCLNHLGDLMYRTASDPSEPDPSKKQYSYFAGKWGEKMEEIKEPSRAFIPRYLCKFKPIGPNFVYTPIETLPPDAARVIPLLPGHGEFRQTMERYGPNLFPQVAFHKPGAMEGQAMNFEMPQFDSLSYLPWLDAYFEVGPLLHPVLTFRPDGSVTPHPLPYLLQFWSRYTNMSAHVYATREGLLWDVQHKKTGLSKGGLYLQTPKVLLRIDDGVVTAGTQVSPNGCRIFTGIKRYRTGLSTPSQIGLLTIDVCQEQKS